MTPMSLAPFHPIIADWFREKFGEPTEPQKLGWPPILSGEDTLIAAPTGSGKTLAAFLCGWMTLLSISTGALAAVAMGFAGYVERYADLAPLGGRIGMAALTITVLGVTNYLGVRPGAAVQNVLTVAKIAALGSLIAGGLLLWASVGAPLPAADAPPARESLVSGFAAAFVAVLFTIGVVGVMLKRNVISMFMCIELMLNSVNLTFVAFSSFFRDVSGQLFVFIVMTVAAAEAAVGLGIIIAIFRNRESLDVDDANSLRL